MYFFFYQNIIQYNLLTKIHYKNNFQISNIKQINLNINLNENKLEKKKIVFLYVLLKLITNLNSFLIQSKKNEVTLKIRKGEIVGLKIILKKKYIFFLIEKLIFNIFPKLKNFYGFKLKKNILSFKISNFLDFFEIKKEFLKFKNISIINFNIETNNKNLNETKLLLNHLNFYLNSENNSIG